MYTFEKSLFINRPPQEVFDFATNPANFAQWQSSTECAEWTSDRPPGVGSTFKIETKFLGRKIEAEVEMTGWDSPNLSSIKSVAGPFPIASTSRFEPKENGTQVTLEGQINSVGIFKLVEGLVGKQAKKQDGNNFDALKLLLEAG